MQHILHRSGLLLFIYFFIMIIQVINKLTVTQGQSLIRAGPALCMSSGQNGGIKDKGQLNEFL